ncbi:serine hydrolase [Aurantibacter crassamenti]|uniref:serine hydrolase n=1 Tax=Aurantibacter crassamenti TaxID=1837375 RepID=UPI00193AB80F|nr:serine hydrolase [Aurantibacter crassamenti]MBM1106390.1 serine hydrolase [Aurantibacter crassamenti]
MKIKSFRISIVALFILLLSCNSKVKENLSLESQLNELIENFDGEAHLYAENITTGQIIDIDASSIHNAASEAKIYILLTYAEQVISGTLDPTSLITLTEEDKVLGSGVLRFEYSGNQVSLSFVAYLMMSISDNVATNILLREVGGIASVDKFLKKVGINDTKVKGEVFKGDWISTSAKSLATAAQILARPEKYGYSKKAADLCKSIMLKHYEDNGLARHLPWSPFVEEVTTMEAFEKYKPIYAGIELYGKAGYTPGYRGDVAYIKTSKSEYVIGLKCTNVDDSKPLNSTNAGFEFSAEIGELLYNNWGK